MDSKTKDYVARMQSASGRMSRLISDLLDYSQVRIGNEKLTIVDLNKAVRGVLSDLEIKISEKKADIRVSELPRIEANAMRMSQLFLNLISNAMKFHKPKEPPKIYIDSGPSEAGYVDIRVKDEGIGIEKQYTERIMKPFERLHSRSEYEGTGIGLAVCSRIVKQHQGKLWVESEKGKGSVFVARLPVKQPGENEAYKGR
jgi:signal transduction histidine kinase